MRTRGLFCFMVFSWMFLFLPQTCLSSIRRVANLSLGFQRSPMDFIDNNGLFLVSNTSSFGFGFNANSDVTTFSLVIIHMRTARIIWSANLNFPIRSSDKFMFDDDGNASLQSKGKVVWSANTAKTGVSAMELLETWNLVLVKDDGSIVWQRFSHPTNTLMPNQDFINGMKLVSNVKNNLTHLLQFRKEDLILSADFKNLQPYWSMVKDKRTIINRSGGDANSATIEANSWRFYDENKNFLWQFVFVDKYYANDTWVAVLEGNGFINLYNLETQITGNSQTPDDSCNRPQACASYFVCRNGNMCRCPLGLAQVNCNPKVESLCDKSKDLSSLVIPAKNLSYFALGLISPDSKTDLDGCKSLCLNNLIMGIHYHKKKNESSEVLDETSEEDTFLENISGMLIRFTYKDLEEATNSFTTKLGHGGFGSVYKGIDGFSGSVFWIGIQDMILLLVKLKDYDIAIGKAKGLAYLHDGCDAKIIHCDIKPENVLLDDKFLAKVSDFGMAKLMIREQSNVFTTLRGTRRYLAPEWITTRAISEKSNIYSYGMVLVEIISGRKNYAFRMMEEGKGEILLDEKLKVDRNDERVIVATRVALWCIQDDIDLRPSMDIGYGCLKDYALFLYHPRVVKPGFI
nr:G-type lectin S-receptor-like serine/threonine-protein kinase SD2-5 [Tanacetum cinerariifolium]